MLLRLCFLILAVLILGTASAENGETMMNTFTPDWSNVKPLGRTHQLPDSLWLTSSGSGAEFAFTGSHCEGTIAGDINARAGASENLVRIAIEVDGVRVVDDLVNAQEKTYIVVSGSDVKAMWYASSSCPKPLCPPVV